MRDLVEEKGLFTFYRQQQSYEEELQRKKNNQNRTQPQQLSQPSRAFLSRLKKQKGEDPSECLKTKRTEEVEEKPPSRYRQRAYGNSVVIINRKITEDTHASQINKALRLEGEQSSSKGRYLQHKQIQLSSHSPQQTPMKSVSKLGKRRISQRPKKRDERQESLASSELAQKSDTNKLPTLPMAHLDEHDIQSSKRHRQGGSALRFQGGKLLRHIRISLKSQVDMHSNNSSVSYIDYTRHSYISERRPVHAKLSSDQRKIMQLLEQYRRS